MADLKINLSFVTTVITVDFLTSTEPRASLLVQDQLTVLTGVPGLTAAPTQDRYSVDRRARAYSGTYTVYGTVLTGVPGLTAAPAQYTVQC